jgi:hypothetical protein
LGFAASKTGGWGSSPSTPANPRGQESGIRYHEKPFPIP